ncbi:hypothetical protein L484_009548 [Morus notabilis]|uniref:Fungal lipase-type domain-containing protein n=1 Tax=Morus notabilis TaxID=981085 RepID=W9SHY5_9ROSA|nr:uncharacterized protein LOC21392873 [Morus notabilis]EXC32848.1 hypothetical protein L484_009548 [Morus notabilis]
MASTDYVSQNHLLLKPKEASLIELIRLLYSPELKKRCFIECSEEEGEQSRDFRRRWIVFVSVVAQKLFLILKEPMAMVGDVLESWLNLLAANGGFLALLRNYFRGNLVRLDQSSSASILGHLDWRVELDKNIEPNDEKYKGSLSMMAAKLAYENEYFITRIVQNHWKMRFLGFYNFWNCYLEKHSTPAFIFQDKINDPKLIAVAFRGTDPFDADAWRTDFDISWYELQNVGKIHRGFINGIGLQQDNTWPAELDDHDQQGVNGGQQNRSFAYYEIKKMLKAMLQENKDAKFIVTGHSLGGAWAILFVAGLAIHNEALLMDRLEGVYTFGQPRVGDEHFGTFMTKKLQDFNVKYRRYVYCNDLVPRIPYDDKTLLFKHFGPCLYFDSYYKGKVLSEEPNKNYFSLVWLLPKYINAVWELIRGFVIPFIKGSDYKENWLMRMLRVVGLVIPGLSAHSPLDYVNLTRLGSLPSLPSLKYLIRQEDSKVE